MIGIFKKIFGSRNEREVKKLHPLVDQINAAEEQLKSLSDEDLRQKTNGWKSHLSEIKDDAELAKELDEILPEAYAVVKNACRRLISQEIDVRGHLLKWDMVPFDVQLIGGMGLHRGKIAEMATGEGKTLVATLPVFLNALSGRGVHVVTVNDYLAQRDGEWMGAIYRFLGLTVGCIVHDQSPAVRRAQYQCDITYGTASEFGFDYLRDNGMASRKEEQVQRGHYFAIVDEVDSILIDEARVPLIISGPAVVNVDNSNYAKFKIAIENLVHHQTKLCQRFLDEADELIKKLRPEDGSNPKNRGDIEHNIGLLLFRVKSGQPRSEHLARLHEDPELLKLMNKAELTLHTDQSKKMLYAEKEELYFAMEEKGHSADLTEKGREFLGPKDPEAFMLPDLITGFHEIDSDNSLDAKARIDKKAKLQEEFDVKGQNIHIISQLLKAYCLYLIDVHYIIENGKIVIVDENTGRKMAGRRWSDGLHQAVEAKEGVTIERETQTYATITIQNYFRLYDKLSGMTGTAETEANEFFEIYNLGVIVIPTNRPCLRDDVNDTVYKTKREKFEAVVHEIQRVHAKGRPILVGTASVESSETLSRFLKKAGVIHSVLNAKFHEQEAEIVARAGQKSSVTIATNMAGRGTDIKLGPGIAELGGLHVVGTERHESRRTDRQLRGRCARQGDPGSSHFFIALEDDLMRLFGSDRIVKIMERVGLEEGQELEHPLLNRSIETAQKRVEQHNFQSRKRVLEYDDVMNKQREVLYGFRNEIIHGDDVRDRLMDIMEEVVLSKVEEFTSSDQHPKEWNFRGLTDWVNHNFPLEIPENEITNSATEARQAPVSDSMFAHLNVGQFGVLTFISDKVRDAYELKISFEDPSHLESIERFTILSAIDKLWQEHLYTMDSLRTAIGLRAHGQRDPLLEYKADAYKLFEELMVSIKTEICHNIFRSASSMMAFEKFMQNLPQKTSHASGTGGFGGGGGAADSASSVVSEANEAVAKSRALPARTGPKVGRNDPCPCGSGKKYKQCCGKN